MPVVLPEAKVLGSYRLNTEDCETSAQRLDAPRNHEFSGTAPIMSLFIFLTVLQALVGAVLVLVILIQRSEGGGLGVGGSPGGLMSARGAANFLTRLTAILAIAFVTLSIVLAAVAVGSASGAKVDTSLKRGAPAGAPAGAPLNADPLAGVGGAAPAPAPVLVSPTPGESPAPANDPLKGAAQ